MNTQPPIPLLPCPFCGAHARKDHVGNSPEPEHRVICSRCHIRTSDDYSDQAEIAWNQRTQPGIDLTAYRREEVTKWDKEYNKGFDYAIAVMRHLADPNDDIKTEYYTRGWDESKEHYATSGPGDVPSVAGMIATEQFAMHGKPSEISDVEHLRELMALSEKALMVGTEVIIRVDDAFELLRPYLRTTEPVSSEFTKSEGYLKGQAYPCGCHKCDDARRADPSQHVPPRLMILCSKCGNKRCPHATDHELNCSGSNDPGQKGSVYE